jgi:phospholipid/cholesterol/gamma-HCH transport system substrate-binding protein
MVGATVLIGLVVLAWMILQFGGKVVTPLAPARLGVQFDTPRADGLAEGSQVTYRGVSVGQVTAITRSSDGKNVVIKAEIDTQPPLPANVRGEIRTMGLIGTGAQLAVELTDPEPQGQLHPGDHIATAYMGGFSSMLPPEFAEAAAEFRKVAEQLRQSKLVEHIDEQVQHAGKMIDSIQKYTDDEKNRQNLQASIENMRTATETANRISKNLEEFSTNLNKISDDTRGAITDARATIQKTDTRIDDIAKQSMARLEQISKLLEQFQSIAGKIDKGQGTAGALVNDPKLYQGLVDTTQELKLTIADLRRLAEQWEQEGLSLKMK